MKTIATFFAVILFASNSMAASQCAELKKELQAMQKAQAQIMASLVNNHETFASSLEEYSTTMKTAKGSAVKAVSKEMDQSAQAFRTRGVQGKKMATQLNAATGDLLARVASCLN
ncbi:hypothetical protein [Bdellovibrio bacteriovorus]|uniref:Uncharacterized protein n=1 Tax=Bdellovibrio bacteriovorus TaxID=959 RepID=A0A1Z3N4J5_BDEBC|nr:hypothetical protein [Bdellovibrio bacteriovorus]ASD62403.1 hypothetical protein B9G79_01895 [Bdellovibrio bacteriovorus]